MIKVRHSSFSGLTGIAIRQSTKTFSNGDVYPSAIVEWNIPTIADTNMALYNLVFIVPAPSRKV